MTILKVGFWILRIICIDKSYIWFSNFDQLKLVVTPAIWMQVKIKKSILKKYPNDVVRNGINTNIFQFNNNFELIPFPYDTNKIIILSVIGNLDDSNKGYSRLVELSSKIRNERVIFFVVGDSRIKRMNTENIYHISKISDKKYLNELYNCSDFLIILSEYETYPTVCLEASATNTPIIGYDIDGVREASHVQNHLFPLDSNQLIEFIDGIKSKTFKQPINTFKELDNELMVNKYLKLYQEVMN